MKTNSINQNDIDGLISFNNALKYGELLKKGYINYPIVGYYEVNPEIFDPKILEIIKYSIEDEE